MANTLTPILPKILARVLAATRPAMSILPLVNKDWSTELAQKGETINVQLSEPMVASDVAPSTSAAPTPTDVAQTTTPITLDKHKHIAFSLTDKEITMIDKDSSFMPGQAEEAMIGLFTQMTSDVFSLYKKVYTVAGTAGTTPFASSTDIINEVSRKLTQLRTSNRERRFILDPFATEKAKNLASFSDMDKAGSSVKTDGLIGRKLGFDFYEDQDVPLHTAGTGSGYLINGALSAGVKSATVDTGTGTLLEGDIVTFAGHTQSYTLTSALSANVFAFEPALVSAVADNAAVTLVASHRVNLAFTKPAFALAIRSLGTGEIFKGGNIISEMRDPVTGMVARAEVMRANKMTVFDFDVLYGVGAPRPQYAARLLG